MIQHLLDHRESKGITKKKTSISASLTTIKPLAVWITTNSGENSKRDVNTRPPYLSPEKPVCGSKSNT